MTYQVNNMTIRTNNHWRPIIYWHDLTAKEKDHFDWIRDADEYVRDGAMFVRYCGWTYSSCEFLNVYGPLAASFDGVHTDSFFSAVVLKFNKDATRVKMATVTW